MRTIHKFKFKATSNDCFIEIPESAEFLDCQAQSGEIVFWFIVDTTAPTTTRLFTMVFTGQPIKHSKDNYLKTLQCADGIVIHIFEV